MGVLPNPDTDVETMVAHILDVEAYPDNVRYVEGIEVIERRSDTDVTYIQRMNLPVIGRIQVQINLSDYGIRDGFRSHRLGSGRRSYGGAGQEAGAPAPPTTSAPGCSTEDAVGYALASAPLKSDVER